MELTKEQMKRVIEELESSYETKMLEDKFLEEIINLFKKIISKEGESKMTNQLKLVLYAYDLELTPDEQAIYI